MNILTDKELFYALALSPNATAIYAAKNMLIQFANDRMLELWGKDRSVIGMPLEKAVPELVGQPFLDLLQQVWHTGVTYEATDMPAELAVKNGRQTFYFDFVYQAVKNELGETICILNTATDVTERHLNKLKLGETAEKLQQAIDTGNMGTWSINPDTLQVTMSDFIKKLFGFSLDKEAEMDKIVEAVDPAYREPLLQVLSNAISKHQPSDISYPITTTTGERKWVRATGKVFINVNGIPTEYSGLVIDITEQMHSRELLQQNIEYQREIIQALQKSESRLRFLLEDAPVAMAILHGPDMVIESANKKMLETWGKGPDIIGKPLRTGIPELEGQPFLDLLSSVYTSHVPYFGNEVKAVLNQKGKAEDVYANFVYHPVTDPASGLTSIIVTANVVTEQVKARKKAERAEESLRLAIDAAELGSFYIDLESGRFIASPRIRDFFGFLPGDEITYDAAIAQIHADYRKAAADLLEEAITKGARFDMEYPVVGFHDGKMRWVRAIGTLQYGSNGEKAFTGILHDITQKKLEELRKNDFIGMVSHELKTPLTSMAGYIQLLQSLPESRQNETQTAMLAKAYSQVQKMNKMISSFLNLSRLEAGKLELHPEQFRLNELIAQVIEEMQMVSPNHLLTLDEAENVTVHADRDKIANVISNFLSNAVKYAPGKSGIHITCRQNGNTATVSVADDGVGISESDMKKIFNRYYRANANQTIVGFGIGLYLSSEIIQRHSGKIWVDSELGKGSTFHFSIPAVI